MLCQSFLKMQDVFFTPISNSEVIDNDSEHYGPPIVAPESRCCCGLLITGLVEYYGE